MSVVEPARWPPLPTLGDVPCRVSRAPAGRPAERAADPVWVWAWLVIDLNTAYRVDYQAAILRRGKGFLLLGDHPLSGWKR